MKFILAIDSFKGCLTSEEAERAVETGVMRHCKNNADIIKIPMSDGGDGMLEAFNSALKGRVVNVPVHDPIMRKIVAKYCISADGNTAIIEMARAAGLMLLSEDERTPMISTTYGVGEMIVDAVNHGCRNFIVGLGGSATNDCGIGMLKALGCRFYDNGGRLVKECSGRMLSRIFGIDTSDVNPLLKQCRFQIASDVNNPLYGIDGAAYVYAPQKGASADDVKMLDLGLEHFSNIVKDFVGKDFSMSKGAGAAGGLGFVMKAFLDAEIHSGTEMLLDIVKFDDMIQDADYVITGEGSADAQTLMGKLPYGILSHSKAHGVPVVLMAGKVSDRQLLIDAGFDKVICINQDGMTEEEAMKKDVAISRLGNAVCVL